MPLMCVPVLDAFRVPASISCANAFLLRAIDLSSIGSNKLKDSVYLLEEATNVLLLIAAETVTKTLPVTSARSMLSLLWLFMVGTI